MRNAHNVSVTTVRLRVEVRLRQRLRRHAARELERERRRAVRVVRVHDDPRSQFGRRALRTRSRGALRSYRRVERPRAVAVARAPGRRLLGVVFVVVVVFLSGGGGGGRLRDDDFAVLVDRRRGRGGASRLRRRARRLPPLAKRALRVHLESLRDAQGVDVLPTQRVELALETASARHARPQRAQHVPHPPLLRVLLHASRRLRRVRRRPPRGHGGQEIQTREVLRPLVRPIAPRRDVWIREPRGVPKLVRRVRRVQAVVVREQVDEQVAPGEVHRRGGVRGVRVAAADAGDAAQDGAAIRAAVQREGVVSDGGGERGVAAARHRQKLRAQFALFRLLARELAVEPRDVRLRLLHGGGGVRRGQRLEELLYARGFGGGEIRGDRGALRRRGFELLLVRLLLRDQRRLELAAPPPRGLELPLRLLELAL
mmetsp:Transcript_4435/g.15683  ORF Transcript_4435/g.15683 Transcript_4435/m.15683 type:complete len:428 (+) Transcript_4435:343-1626(+)